MTTHATPPVLGIPGVTAELSARLRDGLARVDALLAEVVDHDDPFIARASGHLVEAGGKRFRPMLTLLAAELGDGVTDEVVAAAAGVELTHLASLYHDDVMDEATVRRGVSSVNAAYDNSTAILVGDLLFGKASELVAGLGAEAVLIQAQTFVRLCSGQIRDDRPCPEGVDPVDYYLGVLADKTGVLIATAGRYGVMFSGGAPETVEIMRAYGEKVGVAFQLADDLIDIASDADDSGKLPGTDLREGVDTLAVLRFRGSADPTVPADARLLELLGSDLSADDAALAEAVALLRAHPALEQARAETYAVAREAQALLDPLPDSDAKTALQALAMSVVTRVG
ncbi:polyprenyl synthetase family protein [Terrabacter sp. MAHUQ-38]|uniref:polyprenyl synthetase family protein n=1 Tax=unclassified Terrabacter TaxID=2630222 RepID=UPI00165E13F9|nr:polyprenyl synthetase family protein [Terrabacter sp. MAHUQ-38]MBC9822247.1 polyprenyl synthetase family protein [Terrabacter sp. MAHUQ-38]